MIARTLDPWFDAKVAITKKYGVNASDEEIVASFGHFLHYCRDVWRFDNPEKVYKEMSDAARVGIAKTSTYTGAVETLSGLHRAGKTLALVTTSPKHNLDALIDRLGLRSIFDVILTGEDVAKHKPHPQSLEKAFAALGATDKSKTIMIGDSGNDIEAAANFGCDSILFYPPEHKKFYRLDELTSRNPTYVVTDFRDIAGIVN
ncbi:hypothetical protein CSA80_00345 [Candidatus Saccharibacteria bacterium]|nr:MAG: hypothetical protein CSA80_00345 [Candidatus Saccharibacteria bacterium]